jgi:Rhodanese-like domain
MYWDALTAIATAISMVAFVASAVYVRGQLAALEKARFLEVTNDLFNTWQSTEFVESQLWLLHRLEETTWESFVKTHRADRGEAAFHRVGSFYDRVGTLVRLGLVDEREILSTLGPYAIAVWQKIEPLVKEARRIENSVLFDDFERLLPACHECYVPALGRGGKVNPFSLVQPDDRISQAELKRLLKEGAPLTLLDVRKPDQVARHPETLPGAVRIPPDEVEGRYRELPPDREVVVYCA